MTSPGPVLLAVPMTPMLLVPGCVILASAVFALYAAFQVARPPPGLGPEAPEGWSPTARRIRWAGRGLGWSLLALVGSTVIALLVLALDLDPVFLGVLQPLGVFLSLAAFAGGVALPFFLLCVMTSPLFGRLERQRTRAIARGKSPKILRWQSLFAALLVAVAFAAGMKIGLAIVGR